MAPRVRPPPGPEIIITDILNQPRERAIRKPKLSKTPISDVFVKACEEEDFEKIRACLTLGVDINSRGSDNHSALFNSLSLRDGKIFDFLIGHRDLDVHQINQEQILTWAITVPFCESRLRKLCSLPGIDVNAGQPHPLWWAILHHKVAAIKILAENPALDWNAGEDSGLPFQNSAIVVALKRGYADIVEILLSQPSLNLSRVNDVDGRSVAHFAVEYKHLKESYSEELNVSAFPVKCVELLSKDPRVNWNIKNDDGETPIMVALKNKEMEMFKILLRTPGVDLTGIAHMRKGNEILKEMLQKAEEENRRLPSKVPECPVSHYVSFYFHDLTNIYF